MTTQNDRSKEFKKIYESNYWFNSQVSKDKVEVQTESKSGKGSTLEQTKVIRMEIPLLLKNLNVKIMFDAACGDFNWMKHVDLGNIKYIGADIVPDLIEQNNKLYANQNRSFVVRDVVSDDLPKSDLIYCRDCLVHLPMADIFTALRNFKKSGAKYLLTTTFMSNRINNLNVVVGNWQPLNLMGEPFNLPKPIYVINENCTEAGGNYSDKSLALWDLSTLKL